MLDKVQGRVKQYNATNIGILLLQVTSLEGVVGVQEPHFWTLCTNYYCGGIKLEVSKDCDPKYVISHTQHIFRSVGVNQVYVQLDYEHQANAYQKLREFPSFNQAQNHLHHGQQNHSHSHGHGHSHDHHHDHNH